MFCTKKQTNQRRISDFQIICDGALYDNIMPRSHFVLTKQLRFHNEIGTMKGWTKTQGTQAFHILVPSFFSRCQEYNFLPLLRNGCSLIDPFVFRHFYKVSFESIALFWKYSNKLQVLNPGNLFRNVKPFHLNWRCDQ